MKLPWMLLSAILLFMPAPVVAAPQVSLYSLTANVQSGGVSYRYKSAVLVVVVPPGSQAQIVYVGEKRPFSGTYDGLLELVTANRDGLVMNGGFYANDPASPAGLLMVDQRIISPFNFKQSATLCVEHETGKLKILKTADIKPIAKSIAKMCADGLQTYPIVVQAGRSGVRPQELKLKKHRRSLIGMRRDGSVVAAFFGSPVHLFIAAEFLRAPVRSSRSAQQITGDASRGVQVSSGLGLVDAVNLSGDTDLFAAVNGQVRVGNLEQQLPSAIVIK